MLEWQDEGLRDRLSWHFWPRTNLSPMSVDHLVVLALQGQGQGQGQGQDGCVHDQGWAEA